MNIDPTLLATGIDVLGNIIASAIDRKKPSDKSIELSMDEVMKIQSQMLTVNRESNNLISENRELKEKNRYLEDKLREKDDIERHIENYITLKSDPQKIKYCTSCYGKDGTLIQLNDESDKYGTSNCPVCKNVVTSDRQIAEEVFQRVTGENKRSCLSRGYEPY